MVDRLFLLIALCLTVLTAVWPATSARALMAGQAPDSAESRIDPNRLDSPWAGVGAVKVLAGVFTGVLVDRRFVLTAAHAVDGVEPGSVWFVLNLDEGGGQYLAVRRVVIHPSYRGFTLPFAFHDLALLELAQPAPALAPIYPIDPAPPPAGAVLRLVGYGGSGSGARGPEVRASVAVKRVGANHADRFVDAPGRRGAPAIFLFDFDGDGAPNQMGRERLPNDVETTPSLGDSGAPAFIDDGWRPRLVGMVTFVADPDKLGVARGRFGSVAGGVLLAPSRDWILQTIAP